MLASLWDKIDHRWRLLLKSTVWHHFLIDTAFTFGSRQFSTVNFILAKLTLETRLTLESLLLFISRLALLLVNDLLGLSNRQDLARVLLLQTNPLMDLRKVLPLCHVVLIITGCRKFCIVCSHGCVL